MAKQVKKTSAPETQSAPETTNGDAGDLGDRPDSARAPVSSEPVKNEPDYKAMWEKCCRYIAFIEANEPKVVKFAAWEAKTAG